MIPASSMISLPRNQFIALIVGVCILSAAIGSGLALLAETGPSGARGEQGPRGPKGPEGPEGPSGAAEVEGLEAEVEELRAQVEEGNDLGDIESRLDDLESEISGQGGLGPEELCEEFGLC
jgi:hypothetical protein